MEDDARGTGRRPALENVGPDAAVRTGIVQWGTVPIADTARHSLRYGEWTGALKRAGLFPIEHLLPTITIPDCGRLPPAMQLARTRPLDPETLAAIRARKWGYWFDLGHGQSTLGEAAKETPAQRQSRQRMLYRMNAINGAVAALYGGDLSGKRVLDLACNHGAFSLDLLVRGAAASLGIDLRAENVAKASLLAGHLGIANAAFVEGDIYEAPPAGHEIVLCLGLLYHVTKPWELVERCFHLATEMAVIDTVTHREPFSGFVLGLGQMIPQEHAAGAVNVELHPTYRGLIDLMRAAGFRDVLEVGGTPDPMWNDWSRDVYATGHRRCLIGLK